MRRSPRLVAPAMLVALLLSGCVPSDPTPTPPPTPDATPVFASEEEALAAAEEAYRRYITTTDRILQAGGEGEDELRELVSDELFEVQAEGFAQFRKRGWRSVGDTQVSNVTLQLWDHPTLSMYVCTDLTGVNVVDAAGSSQVSPDRPTTTSYEVTLVWQETAWLVAAEEVWSGSTVC